MSIYYIMSVTEGFTETLPFEYDDEREALAKVCELMLDSYRMGIEYYVSDEPCNVRPLGLDLRTI